MYAQILFIVLSLSIKIIDCYYLHAESNFLKPKLERNNIVNKGIWVRNKMEGYIDKSSLNNFIFRPNSLDVDNVMQDDFDFFGHNTLQDSPFVSGYVQRTRRSPDHIRKRRPRKSVKTGKVIRSSIEDSVMIKSKLVSDLKPTSVFNEYPYEVAILLNDETENAKSRNDHDEKLHHMKLENEIQVAHIDVPVTDRESHIAEEELKIISLNSSDITSEVPKRSKKNYHNNEFGRNMNIAKDNKTENVDKYNKERNIFKEKDVRGWVQNIPAPDNTFYKVVPKAPEKLKPVTERGLIKVISMLTKTFKKIMKQHNDIKSIHDKLLTINKHFDEKVAEIATKFEDFDSKYSDMIQFNNRLKDIENEIRSQKEYFENKQKEIQSSLSEFQRQQNTFLAQQRQFYSIQKLMLAQNEKINEKQNLITQTQSQISLRQNNFARILKKAKQIINENKDKLNISVVKPQDKYVAKVETTVIPITTTTAAPYTESMKINLFSIPIKNKLENQDAQIIKEKDEKQIDDLVYKYYFNNTFIDSLMRSKILNNFASNINSAEIVNRSKWSKNKRNELETTLMLPVNNSLSDTPMKRERRWINHFSKTRYRHINRHKKNNTDTDANKDQKVLVPNENAMNEVKSADDPFTTMAKSFCNQIGQNENEQALKWCIEKALRRLKFMESNSFAPPSVTLMVKQEPKVTVAPSVTHKVKQGDEISSLHTVSPSITRMGVQTTTLEPVSRVTPQIVVSAPTQAVFFPDNDELESNLKDFEMKPDTEGNVYYDGSLHISDYGRLADSDAATSDIMPGLMDSNSRVEIDPVTFDIQAKRRAYVRRFNEKVMKQTHTE